MTAFFLTYFFFLKIRLLFEIYFNVYKIIEFELMIRWLQILAKLKLPKETV